MRYLTISFGFALLLFITPEAITQRATIFYYHSPDRGASRVEHQLPGDLLEHRRAGVPRRIRIPTDGEVCVLIEHANPLLYSYSLRQQPVSVTVPSEATGIASVLAGVLSGAGTPPAGEGDVLTTINVYGDTVAALFQSVVELNTLKLETDGISDFAQAVKMAEQLYQQAKNLNVTANRMYDHPSLKDLHSENPSLRLLRAAHLRTWQEAETIRKEFEDAKSKLQRPICERVGTQLLQVRLAIGRVNNGPQQPARVVGDSVLIAVVEPRSDRRIEIGAGGILTIVTGGQREFSLSDGVIVGSDDNQPQFRPAIFLLGRAWSEQWLWGAIGASADDSGLSNLFLGLAGRFGEEIAGLRMTLGIGLSVNRTVVGLKNGVREGQPLPPDVGKLDELLDRELRAGLGFLISLNGS